MPPDPSPPERSRPAPRGHAARPGASIADCTCLALRQAARHVSQFYDQALAPSGLRTTQFSILAALAGDGPQPIKALARALVLDRTTLGRTMLPLEREGLIAIAPNPADRRSKALALTPAGAQRLREAAPLWRDAQARFDAAYGAAASLALRQELQALARAPLGPGPGRT